MVQGLGFEFRGLGLRVEGCMEEWKSRLQLLGFVGFEFRGLGLRVVWRNGKADGNCWGL